MNIFKSAKFTWWQLGILKWATLFFGLSIGATWPEIFAPYTTILLIIALIAGLYLGVIWAKK
jgi:hypothetical protein